MPVFGQKLPFYACNMDKLTQKQKSVNRKFRLTKEKSFYIMNNHLIVS